MERTKEYYNTISTPLLDWFDHYYNGSLIVDPDSDPNTFIEQDVNNIIKLAELNEDVSILECGCGVGQFFKLFVEKFPSVSYRGIDISEEQIKNAKIVNPDYADLFEVADWHKLPFEDNSFDRIIFLETIGYTWDVDKLLSECYRVLKPGGILFSKHPGVVNNIDDQKKFNLQLDFLKQSTHNVNVEYGYEDNSLGMLMDAKKFVEDLNRYNFDVPNGCQTPFIDESTYIELHFLPIFKQYLKKIKLESRITSILPTYVPSTFKDGSSEILNAFGKLHPHLMNLFLNIQYSETHATMNNLFRSCVVITAYKK